MIVEFLGISGVGKSTICSKYYKEKLEENKKIEWSRNVIYNERSWIYRNLIKLFQVIFFGITNISFTIKLIKILNKTDIKGKKELLKLLFNGLHLKYLLSKCKEDNVEYIFDEGAFQYIWAIYLRCNTIYESITKDILLLFGYPDKLIIVEAENETIAKRLKTRNVKTKILEADNLLIKIEKMKDILNNIIEYSIKEREDFANKLFYIDNNKEIK